MIDGATGRESPSSRPGESAAGSPRTAVWLRVAALSSAAISATLLCVRAVRAPDTQFDDAYMFVRYALHFLGGHGHVWNIGEDAVYGSTSLLHFAVVTLLTAITPNAPATALRWASMVPALAAVPLLAAACARATRQLSSRWGAIEWCGVIAPLLLLATPWTWHALSGMDTMLAVATNSLLLLAALRLRDRPSSAACAAAVAAAFVTVLARPDNGLYALLFPPLLLLAADARANRKLAMIYSAALIGVLVVDAGFKTAWIGDPLPLAFFAKRQGFHEGYLGVARWNPVTFLFDLLGGFLPFVLAAAACFSRALLRSYGVYLAPVLLTCAYHFTVVQIMGFEARFYMPALPFLVVLSAMAVTAVVHAPRRTAQGVTARILVAAMLAGWLPVAGEDSGSWYAAHRLRTPRPDATRTTYRISARRALPALNWWQCIEHVAELASALPAGARLGLSEYGFVGARAPDVALLDPLGLHDRTVAHEGFDADTYLAKAPDALWLPHPDYTRMHVGLLDAPAFRAHYDYYPRAFGYGFAIRRDSPHAPDVRSALSRQWREAYPGYPIEGYRAAAVGR